MINFFKKTIISFLLVATLFYVAAPSISIISGNTSSVLSATVYAADETEVSDAFVMYAEGACGVSDMMGCIYAGIYFVTQFIHYLSTYASWAGGEIFDAAIKFAITGDLFDASVNSMIGVGWELLRDFANMFFIFIILYIAIATILQIGTYGGKDMLVKVIVAAVLINFSLLFTSMIIDASHILAWSFYDKINVQGDIEFPEIAPSIQIVDIHKDTLGKGLSTVTMAATGAANTVAETYEVWTSADKLVATAKEQLWNRWFRPEEENEDRSDVESNADKITRLTKEGKEVIRTSLNNLSLLYVMSSLLNFIIGFVFFAGAAMFIVRVLVLWVVMIFSPLGFVAPIMPKALASYASKWWDHLIKQAFFAPAFLFMFMLATELINSKILKATIIVNEDNLVDKVIPFTVKGTIVIIFQTMVIVFFLGLCLYVAKSMGAIGSDLMVNWGKTAGNWARNKVGDKAALRWGGKGARRLSGRPAEWLAASDSKVAGALRAIPFVARGASNVAQKNRARIDELQKGYEKYNDRELQNMLKVSGLLPFNRTAIVQELTKRKSLDSNKVEAKYVKASTDLLGAYGAKTKDMERLRPELVTGDIKDYMDKKPEEYKKLESKYSRDRAMLKKEAQKAADAYAREQVIKKIKSSDLENVSDDLFKNEEMLNSALRSFNGNHAEKIIDRGGGANKFFEKMVSEFGNSYDEISNKLLEMGNKSLAAWVKSPVGKMQLDAFGKKRDPAVVGGGTWMDSETVDAIKEVAKEAKKSATSFDGGAGV